MLACNARTCDIRTEDFDGPLELLLFLVRQHGVDIRTMPIAPITDAYLAQIRLMDVFDLDTAGDFLVIAATLCLIKSREMFPRTSLLDGAEEEEDPTALRDSLARRLLDYERFREASQVLADRPLLGRDVFAGQPSPTPGNERNIDVGVDPMGLLQVFYDVLQHSAIPPEVHAISRQTVSIEEVANWMLARLEKGPLELTELMHSLANSAHRVMAFLCTLELAKMGLISLEQQGHLSAIVLESCRNPEPSDLKVLGGGLA